MYDIEFLIGWELFKFRVSWFLEFTNIANQLVDQEIRTKNKLLAVFRPQLPFGANWAATSIFPKNFEFRKHAWDQFWGCSIFISWQGQEFIAVCTKPQNLLFSATNRDIGEIPWFSFSIVTNRNYSLIPWQIATPKVSRCLKSNPNQMYQI